MKIIHIISEIDNESNGVAYSAPSIVKRIQCQGEEIQIYTFGSNTDKWKELNVKTFIKWGGWIENFQFSSELFFEVKKNIGNVDIIHCQGTRVFPFVLPFYFKKKKKETKIIISPRGSLANHVFYSRKIKKLISDYILGQNRAFANADMFHATSRQEYLEIREKVNEHKPVAIIPNGIDPIRIEESVSKEKTVLFLSRIDTKKNIRSLINAWAKLEKDYPDWKLLVVGEKNSLSGKLEKLSKELNTQNVFFKGGIYGKEKYKLFAKSSVFILPSFNESFGNVVAESLMCGTPVITTKNTPWSSVVEKKCGWWIDHDAISIENQLRYCMNLSTETLSKMGKKGRTWMLQEFSWEKRASELLTAYRWLITPKKYDKPLFVKID